MSDWEQQHQENGLFADDGKPLQHALSLPVPALKQIVEAAVLASGEPVSIERVQGLFEDRERPSRGAVSAAFEALRDDYQGHGIELVEVAGGWRAQVRASVAPWVGRLWQEKPSRYSRALLETLALIAYRQPITRGEIEQVRGVAVSSSIIKTLTEREWVRVVGHRDVPGRPALYATTRRFLDYFGLRSLNELPPLTEVRDASFFEQALNQETNSAGLGSAAAPTSSGLAEDAVDHGLDEATEIAPQALFTRPTGRPRLVLAVSNEATAGEQEPSPNGSESTAELTNVLEHNTDDQDQGPC